jgi:hypothetical protein
VTETSQQIGYVLRAVEDLTRSNADIAALIREQGVHADAERRKLTESMDGIVNRLEAVESKVKLFEPIASDFNKWRERGMGAMMLIGLVASAVAGLLGAFWTKIIGYFWPGQ